MVGRLNISGDTIGLSVIQTVGHAKEGVSCYMLGYTVRQQLHTDRNSRFVKEDASCYGACRTCLRGLGGSWQAVTHCFNLPSWRPVFLTNSAIWLWQGRGPVMAHIGFNW